MAHFKRGYRRTVNKTAPRRMSTPSSWNITFHSRPRRRKDKVIAHDVVKGGDPAAALWATAKKPHRYYW